MPPYSKSYKVSEAVLFVLRLVIVLWYGFLAMGLVVAVELVAYGQEQERQERRSDIIRQSRQGGLS